MRARIQRLRAEIGSDRAALQRRRAELAGVTAEALAADPAVRALVAVALHHLYSAVEAILVRVSTTFEEGGTTGEDWHKSLLERMGLDIEGVRPAVLSAETLAGLRRLLAFRHFFRHAYTVELAAGHLTRLRDEALGVAGPLDEDLDRLDAFLADIAAAVD